MALKLGEQLIAMIEQGGTAGAAFNAVDGTIDSMTKTVYFLTANRVLIQE